MNNVGKPSATGQPTRPTQPVFFVYLVIFIFILFLTISVRTNISTSTEPIITNFAGLVELSIPLRLQV